MISLKKIQMLINLEYDKDPTGWHFCMAPDKKFGYTVFLPHWDDLFLIKQDTIFSPKAIGYGVKIRNYDQAPILEEICRDPVTWGFRSMPEFMIQKYLTGELTQQDVELANNSKVISLQELFQQIEEKKCDVVQYGPRVFSYSPLAPISKQQQKLERELRKEVVKRVDFRAYT